MTSGKYYCLVFLSVLLSACSAMSTNKGRSANETRTELGVRLRVVPAEGLSPLIIAGRSHLLSVVSVKPGLSAARAGIKVGDIVLGINGKPVSGMADSVAMVQPLKWGDSLLVSIMRDDLVSRIPVLLSRNPAATTNPKSAMSADAALDSQLLSESRESNLPIVTVTGQFSERNVVASKTLVEHRIQRGESIGVILKNTTNVRRAPSMGAPVDATLQKYDLVVVIDNNGQWYQVSKYDDSTVIGFVHNSLLNMPGAQD